MNRLHYASARGAKIERCYYIHPAGDVYTRWEPAGHLPLPCGWDDYNYRIAPSDEHLQYGPISTVLRRWATTGELVLIDLPDYEAMACELISEHMKWQQYGTQDCCAIEHRTNFLLILAEYLSDEGL